MVSVPTTYVSHYRAYVPGSCVCVESFFLSRNYSVVGRRLYTWASRGVHMFLLHVPIVYRRVMDTTINF